MLVYYLCLSTLICIWGEMLSGSLLGFFPVSFLPEYSFFFVTETIEGMAPVQETLRHVFCALAMLYFFV